MKEIARLGAAAVVGTAAGVATYRGVDALDELVTPEAKAFIERVATEHANRVMDHALFSRRQARRAAGLLMEQLSFFQREGRRTERWLERKSLFRHVPRPPRHAAVRDKLAGWYEMTQSAARVCEIGSETFKGGRRFWQRYSTRRELELLPPVDMTSYIARIEIPESLRVTQDAFYQWLRTQLTNMANDLVQFSKDELRGLKSERHGGRFNPNKVRMTLSEMASRTVWLSTLLTLWAQLAAVAEATDSTSDMIKLAGEHNGLIVRANGPQQSITAPRHEA